MTFVHTPPTLSDHGVDIVEAMHSTCGPENALVPTFSHSYPQSTGPTPTSTLSYFKQQKQNQGKNK
jgi:hypothetical protein